MPWEEGLRRGYDKNASHFKPKKYEKAFPKALAAVHKSNVAARLRPRLNHDLHAIDASPAR